MHKHLSRHANGSLHAAFLKFDYVSSRHMKSAREPPFKHTMVAHARDGRLREIGQGDKNTNAGRQLQRHSSRQTCIEHP